jgi:Na+-driven multidrug efflux pump
MVFMCTFDSVKNVVCLHFSNTPIMHIFSREMADEESHSPAVRAKLVRHMINGSILVGGGVAGLLSITTFLQRDSILKGLTTNLAIRDAAKAIFPIVLATQTAKGLCYPVNGIIMGGLDWKYTMFAMWAANLVCVGMIRFFGRGGALVTLNQVWTALFFFMFTQLVTGVLRYRSKTGVWKVLKEDV